MKKNIILLLFLLFQNINLKSLEEKMTNCIKYLLNEKDSFNNKNIFQELEDIENKYKSNTKKRIDEKFRLYRTLNSLRNPSPIPSSYIEDESFLSELILQKGLFEINDLSPISTINRIKNNNDLFIFNNIYLYKGDIIQLKLDAIVNAGNNQLLGCWVPLHNCIDNVIFSYAGIQLRNEMDKIMKKQGTPEPTGEAKISKAYNLPSKYIIHTVGPMVQNILKEEHKIQLKNSYLNVLKLAKKNNIKTLAFCCISTGLYGFPNEEAADIAINTVFHFLNNEQNKDIKIVFNVYKDIDEKIYMRKLKEKMENINNYEL